MSAKNLKRLMFICAISLFSIPIVIFISIFYNYSISLEFSDWMEFGNVYLGFTSILILSLLTYSVSLQSNDANKKLSYSSKRLEAFSELTSYVPNINKFFSEFTKSIQRLNREIENKNFKKIKRLQKELEIKIDNFNNFHHFLASFELRFGIFFDYKFSEKNYSDLIIKSGEAFKYLNGLLEYFEFGGDEPNQIFLNVMNPYLFNLKIVINELRQNLDNDVIILNQKKS